MESCRECESLYWKQAYFTAEQRFDKAQARFIAITITLCVIMAVCVFITALCSIRTQHFIADFEYVEETEVEIQQDSEGGNLAVIGDRNEVNYGAENHN